jgi:hypothetical protein
VQCGQRRASSPDRGGGSRALSGGLAASRAVDDPVTMEPPHSAVEACDRTRSSEARASLRRILWDPISARRRRLPRDCPLAPFADILRGQESAKRPISASHWQCGLCGKNFRSEHFLDKHLARKHAADRTLDDVDGAGGQATCFANLCGVAVPCPPVSRVPLPPVSTLLLQVEDAAPAPTKTADGADVSRQRPRLCTDPVERLTNRHACFDLIRRCVALEAASSEADLVQLRTHLHGALCDDAPEVECIPWSERLAWRAQVDLDGEVSTRHVLGWILLALIAIVHAIGRYANRLRLGEEDFVRPRRRARGWPRAVEASDKQT